MQSTTNYGMFRTVKGNRAVSPEHLKRLIERIEEKDLLEQFPILVNEQNEIIDGQHRLAAASYLNIPIYYQSVRDLTLTDVISLNTVAKNWSLLDFIKSHIELGAPDYAELLDFINEFGIGAGISASLLEGRTSMQGGGITNRVRSGAFRIKTRGNARRVAQALIDLMPYADFKTKSSRDLALALAILFQNEDFSIDRLLNKMKTHNLVLKKRLNPRYYMLELEELYNFNAKDKVTLYAGQI